MKKHSSSGPLRYSRTAEGGYKLIVEVDPGITSLYRALIPRWANINPQRYPPHISVVRHEIPPNLDFWGKYEGEIVPFEYFNHIYHGEIYWWLNVYSLRLEEIRLELGLPVDSPYTRPPDGLAKTFHTTLGNQK